MSVKGCTQNEDADVMETQDVKKEKRLTKTQSTFLKLFECPVCFERICPPVTVCIYGHAVCGSCRLKLLTCPTCKSDFSKYRNTMIDQIIAENVFPCKYSDRGCTIELKFQSIEDHEKKSCRYRTLTCALVKNEVPCEGEVPIWEYYIHVLRNHPQESINFRVETHRTLDISGQISKTNILKNIKNQKILFETIKLDQVAKKFYIMYQYIGLYDDSVFQLRIYNKNQTYKQLTYSNVCAPVGLSQQDLDNSDKCLILDPQLLNNFATEGILSYSIKIDTIPKKWIQAIKDKIACSPLRIINPGVSSSSCH